MLFRLLYPSFRRKPPLSSMPFGISTRRVLVQPCSPFCSRLAQAFVIYCFFHLLLEYLGGERSLLILLHGRPPIIPVFPINLFVRELDVSDPHTFLFLKRGILRVSRFYRFGPILICICRIRSNQTCARACYRPSQSHWKVRRGRLSR